MTAAATSLESKAIALNRFGLGARADEPLPADPKAWLLQQFTSFAPAPAAFAGLAGSREIVRTLGEQRAQLREARQAAQAGAEKGQDAAKKVSRLPMLRDARNNYRKSVDARAAAALVTQAPFVERLVHFWSNHFAVSTDKAAVVPFAGAYELEAIRPHVLGRFEDLLLAVERHAAMQLYLDQSRSTGPNSALARRAAGRDRTLGLNENLAREILELHTLGVRTGYTQQDVTELARALTGWSLGAFRPAMHEPGARAILGHTYAQQGEAQALAVLHTLATSPDTAKHVATKLACHFVSDAPPPALVARLAATFTKSSGDLRAVYRTLIESGESWGSVARKFKTPWEWTLSALRGIGMRDLGEMEIAPLLQQLGQPVWRPGSPAGFDDVSATWAAPDALVRRVEVAQRLASRVGDRVDARALGEQLLPGMLAPATRAAIARAESPAAGLALLLVSPDFLRR